MQVLMQNFLFHRFMSAVAIKASLLIFNMFNIYKNNISKMFLVFFLT